MRLKLGENLGAAIAELLVAAGHDVATVPQQRMSGFPGATVADTCARERRALVTHDLDFANTVRFPPSAYAGLIVLRPSPQWTPTSILGVATTLRDVLARNADATGALWIVEHERFRVY